MDHELIETKWQSAIRWLFEQQNRGIKVGLENTRRLLEVLGNPHQKLPALHVAGTNGKGSVCAFAETILRAAGYRTGLFTSPHLVDFRERIQCNGELIPIADATEGIELLQRLTADWPNPPTFFELTYALAMWHFSRQKLDVVVLETGMGGRLDSTNVCCPLACAITPIGLDHQQWLGETIAQIAGEKAGILKPGVPCVLHPQPEEARVVIVETAHRIGAPVFPVKTPWPHSTPLAGQHQRWNAAAAALLVQTAFPTISDEILQKGIAATRWPARFERIGKRILLDASHNPHAMQVLVETWREEFPSEKASVIFACLKDKNPGEMLALLAPIAERFFLPRIRSPRSMPPEKIAALLQKPTVCLSCEEAMEHALHFSSPILITGSLHLAGEILAIFQKKPAPLPSQQ